MATLLKIEPPSRAQQQKQQGFALFALGFRPFYLLASAFAALTVPLWALQFSGLLGHAYLAGPLWHAHEMVFGFTLAVIVGFLFTAGRNWTNQPTPSGLALAALAAVWIAARVLVLTPFAVPAAVANVAFPLAAAVGLAIPFYRARNQRNYFFVGLLLVLAAAAGLFHLSQLGVFAAPAWLGIRLALDVVLFIAVVMGGRVIPMFTNNGVPGAQAVRQPLVEKGALGAVLALLMADVLGLQGWGPALIAGVAAVHMPGAGRCGSPGKRCASRWCGCCTWLTRGCRFTCCSGPWVIWGWCSLRWPAMPWRWVRWAGSSSA